MKFYFHILENGTVNPSVTSLLQTGSSVNTTTLEFDLYINNVLLYHKAAGAAMPTGTLASTGTKDLIRTVVSGESTFLLDAPDIAVGGSMELRVRFELSGKIIDRTFTVFDYDLGNDTANTGRDNPIVDFIFNVSANAGVAYASWRNPRTNALHLLYTTDTVGTVTWKTEDDVLLGTGTSAVLNTSARRVKCVLVHGGGTVDGCKEILPAFVLLPELGIEFTTAAVPVLTVQNFISRMVVSLDATKLTWFRRNGIDYQLNYTQFTVRQVYTNLSTGIVESDSSGIWTPFTNGTVPTTYSTINTIPVLAYDEQYSLTVTITPVVVGTAITGISKTVGVHTARNRDLKRVDSNSFTFTNTSNGNLTLRRVKYDGVTETVLSTQSVAAGVTITWDETEDGIYYYKVGTYNNIAWTDYYQVVYAVHTALDNAIVTLASKLIEVPTDCDCDDICNFKLPEIVNTDEMYNCTSFILLYGAYMALLNRMYSVNGMFISITNEFSADVISLTKLYTKLKEYV